jgi:hypothetical protein
MGNPGKLTDRDGKLCRRGLLVTQRDGRLSNQPAIAAFMRNLSASSVALICENPRNLRLVSTI